MGSRTQERPPAGTGAIKPVQPMSNTHDQKPAQGRNQRNRRRRRQGGQGGHPHVSSTPTHKPAPKKKPGLISKILGLVGLGGKSKTSKPKAAAASSAAPADAAKKPAAVTRTTIKGHASAEPRPRKEKAPPRKPESVEVTSSRLYIGNLSYDASESDLRDVFNGVGRVQSVEVVTNQRTQRSKGYGFVEMGSVEEARRAVAELHDKEFMGRKMVVSGAKPRDEEDAA